MGCNKLSLCFLMGIEEGWGCGCRGNVGGLWICRVVESRILLVGWVGRG